MYDSGGLGARCVRCGRTAKRDGYGACHSNQISADDEGVPRLYQSGLYLEADSTYGFKVDACAKEATDITVRLLDDDGQVISEEQCQVKWIIYYLCS